MQQPAPRYRDPSIHQHVGEGSRAAEDAGGGHAVEDELSADAGGAAADRPGPAMDCEGGEGKDYLYFALSYLHLYSRR